MADAARVVDQRHDTASSRSTRRQASPEAIEQVLMDDMTLTFNDKREGGAHAGSQQCWVDLDRTLMDEMNVHRKMKPERRLLINVLLLFVVATAVILALYADIARTIASVADGFWTGLPPVIANDPMMPTNAPLEQALRLVNGTDRALGQGQN